MRNALCLIVLLLLPAAAPAETPLQSATSALASGELLLDRALDLAGSAELRGGADAPAIDAARLRQLVHQLHAASARPLAWPDTDALRALAATAEPGAIPLALVDAPVARLRPDALSAGLLRWEGGRLVPTGAGEPLERSRVFAAAALAASTARGGALELRLADGQILSAERGATYALDADDGLGFRRLEPDVVFPVRYGSTGVKTLTLRSSRSGATRSARFTLDVRALQTPPLDAVWPLVATIPYAGGVASGEAFVYLAPGHAAVTDPVIVVEGFDLDNTMNWDELYLLLNQENLLEDLRASGYDAVILNFTDSTDYIQRNAYLLEKLIETVNGELDDPAQTVALVGASMGGLVSRYALAAMEDAGLPHGVRTFVSFDSPQGGANIPLGIQYWLDLFRIESDEAGHLLSRLDRPSARQMLLYHHTSPPGGSGVADPLRGVLLDELAALGDYPADPYLVAVANGSGQMENQGFGPAQQIIYYEYESLLVDIVGNVWALPDFVPGQILHGEIDRIWPLDDDFLSVSVSGTWPYDGAPGGSRASMTEMDEVDAPYGDIVALYPAHCFVPTYSALDLDVADPFFDFASAGDLLALSPFDELHFPAANQEHVLVTTENETWLIDAITRPATAAPVAAPGVAARLLAAHPNPFNPQTRVAFELARPGPVRLSVHDAAGRLLRVLLDAELTAGAHALDWDGRDGRGRALASGVYLVALRAGQTRDAQRIVLLR